MKKQAFTLVELLVAISILAVLMAILLPNLMGARDKAKDSQNIQGLNTLKNALRMRYNNKQTYVFDISDNVLSDAEKSNEDWVNDGCTGCLSDLVTDGYLPSLESIGYSYATTSDGDGFVIWTGLKASSGNDDVESQAKCGIGATINSYFVVCAN